jgi:ABC-2 type transport system ATP-binding protein
LIMSQGENLAMGTPSEIRALARSKENPEPTIEDAFIALAQGEITPSGGQNLVENDGGEK